MQKTVQMDGLFCSHTSIQFSSADCRFISVFVCLSVFGKNSRNPSATIKVRISAAGTASQMPFMPQKRGRTIKNNNSSAKERKKVMSPEKYPFPYAIIRMAEKILTPENRNPMPYSRMPQTAMVYTTLSLCAKKDTPTGANR